MSQHMPCCAGAEGGGAGASSWEQETERRSGASPGLGRPSWHTLKKLQRPGLYPWPVPC